MGGAATTVNTLALAVATIERPHVVQRLITSARRHFPAIRIYVADQSLSVAAMQDFYASMNVTLVRMPFDAGVCASRNRLVEAIREPYFVLCDDDFVIGARTNFGEAIALLDQHPQIGVVGGRLYDSNGRTEWIRHWELLLELDRQNRTLTSIPIYCYAPRRGDSGAAAFYYCDAVMNFAVMRRAMFERSPVRWDERFKSNGEHEDFYLNLKLHSAERVVYLPTLVAYHHHPTEFGNYRSKLRERLDGWRRFFEKWGIDQHLEIGLGVRSIDHLGEVIPEAEARRRFFLNADLSLQRQADTAALAVTPNGALRVLGATDRRGERRAIPSGARLQIARASGSLLARDAEPPKEPPDVAPGQEELRVRYALTPAGAAALLPVETTLKFRYDPLLRTDADFMVWCRSEGPITGHTPLTVRWFADDGRPLLWAYDARAIGADSAAYWVPLLVQVPLVPSGSQFLRFEILAGESPALRPVGTGYVVPDVARSPGGSTVPEDPIDVGAWTPWTAGATPWIVDETLGQGGPAQRVAAPRRDLGALSILDLGAGRPFDRILIIGAPGAPVACSGPLGPAARPNSPHCVALPARDIDTLRILGVSALGQVIPLTLDFTALDGN